MAIEKRWGWQKCAMYEVIPKGMYRRCLRDGSSGKILRAKDDRRGCDSCEVWRGCGTPGCMIGFDPEHVECRGVDETTGQITKRLARSILDENGCVIGFEAKDKYISVVGEPKVNEEQLDKIAASLLKEPEPKIELRLPPKSKRGSMKIATYEARNVRLSFGGRHFRGDGERCLCGTMEGAKAMGENEYEVGSRCCAGCGRFDVELRVTRGSARYDLPTVSCLACAPLSGIERLEKRRGRKYSIGESPDADLLDLIARVEHYEKLGNISEPAGTREYWETVIELTKPHALTIEEVVSGLAATFDVGGQFVNETALAYAIFVASNVDEIKRRAEVNVETSVRARPVVQIMWNDPTYAKERAKAEEAAARIWKAREVWR